MEPLAALQLGFQTILCSPSFIYMQEGEGALDGYNLASRLSYFLWSSQPDAVLLEHAEAGRLSDANVLDAEVDRMLKDPRSASGSSISSFGAGWTGTTSVKCRCRVNSVCTYRDNLEAAMASETTTFFRHILDQNLPPKREFLDFRRLHLRQSRAGSALRAWPAIEGNQLRQVSTEGTVRGGLMTQGSFPDRLGQRCRHLAGRAWHLRPGEGVGLYTATAAR